MCGGPLAGSSTLSETLITTFSAAAVHATGSPIEPYVRRGAAICPKCYKRTNDSRSFCAETLTPARLELGAALGRESVAEQSRSALKRKAATEAAPTLRKDMSRRGAQRMCDEVRLKRRDSLAARRDVPAADAASVASAEAAASAAATSTATSAPASSTTTIGGASKP